MRRAAVLLFGGLLTLSSAPAAVRAESVTGVLQLPEKYVFKREFSAPGYWRGLSSDLLKKGPPLVDPRQRMIVALEGKDLPSKMLFKPLVTLEDARFWPPVLPVKKGTTVTFQNDERWQHRLVPGKGDTSFSEMSLPPGTNDKVTYNEEGAHEVRCSDTPHMKVTILVLSSPLATRVSAEGLFFFPEVPDGAYTLKVWNQGKWVLSQPVDVKGKAKVKVQLPSDSGKE